MENREMKSYVLPRCLRLRPVIGLYRKYCRADVEELSHLQNMVKRGDIEYLDLNLAFADINA